MSKYVFQIRYGVWMKKSILKFFNKLLFPTLSIWIVQFTVHAYDTTTMKILFLTDSGVVSHFGYTVYRFQLEILDVQLIR